MKKSLFAITAVLVVLTATMAQAMEDKYQMGLFFNGGKEVAPNVKLTYHFSWTNFAGSTSPYMYLGVNKRFSDKFNLEAMFGYGFEPVQENSGFVYALAPSFKFGKWSLSNDFEYWSGLKCLFTGHALTHQVGPIRLGVDERTFYYFESEDAAKRTYRVGPSVRIPFSENVTVGVFYWYSFENDGMDANVFNMSLMLNL